MTIHNCLKRVALLAALLLGGPLYAATPECIRVTFSGVDSQFEDNVFLQLQTELKTPIHKSDGPETCWRLHVELADATSHITLKGDKAFHTAIHLDDFVSLLWPRAIALSVSGLWILAHTENPATPSTDANRNSAPESFANSVDSQPSPEEKPLSPNSRRVAHKTGNAQIPSAPPTDFRFRFHLLTGPRWIPGPGTAVFELAPGVSIVRPGLQLQVSLMGVWGRKTLNSGKIFTAGFGVRTTAFWRVFQRPSILLNIGPSVEVLGVWGTGAGADDVQSHRAFSPVVNMLLLAGMQSPLSPRVLAHVAVGCGYSLVHFNMQQDDKTVSGISGGQLLLLLGLSFGKKAIPKNGMTPINWKEDF
ncbi:MAG: hypothetical protein JXR76_06385 [Deltaproteobacteria bacterium]|nr:hypothetical protein [Deltaproteobacteria bacterium]